MKRIGWVLTLAVAATGMGLWLAPNLVLALSMLTTPQQGRLWQVTALFLYETGLQAPAVALSVAAQRLGWLRGLSGPLTLVLSPALGEILILGLLGATPVALSDAVALLVRLAVIAVAVATVLRVRVGTLPSP